MAELAVYDNDPTLYLFTSLTAGSSHIVTATSRIETILKANKIPFKGVDTATDDLARKLFQRRASGKKLPLLVKEGYVLGDLEMIEEWNEYDELREALGFTGAPAKPVLPTKTAATATASATAAKPDVKKENAPLPSSEQNLAIRQLGAEAAKVAAAKKPTPTKIATTNPLLTEKVNSPAVSTPKSASAEKASPSALLSPRNIPLPATPSAETSSRPSLIKSPSSTSSGSHRSFHGADVEDMPEDEIRKIEQEEAIPEVSSSEEEDSEDEEERRKSVSSLAGSKKEPLTDSAPAAKAKDTKAPEGKDAKGTEGKETRTAAAESSEEESDEDEEDEDEDEESEDDEEEQPQKQPAKAAAKAGSSVKD